MENEPVEDEPTEKQENVSVNVTTNSSDEISQDDQELENVLQVEEEPREKLLKLPIARVKNIVKMDPEVNLVNQEATFLIAKSTELFIESIARESYKYTVQAKKRTVQKRDLEQAIDNIDALAFLEGTLDQFT